MYIPENNAFSYCPKCGSTLRKKEENLLICAACSFKFYLSPKPGVKGIVISEDGRILMTRRNIPPYLGMLDLPGGFIEQLENFEEGLERELYEELGSTLDIKSISYLASFGRPYGYQNILYSVVVPVFIIHLNDNPVFDLFDKKELQEVILIKPEDIDMDEIGTEDYKNILRKFIKNNTGI